MSSKQEQLAELLAARADCQAKRGAFKEARSAWQAAVNRLEELWTEIEGGQERLPFNPDAAKPKPKKPHGSGDQAAAKSDAG